MLLHVAHHFFERSAGEEDLIHPFALHLARVFMRDRPTASPEDCDVVDAALAQLLDHIREKFDVAAVITGDTDCGHVLLDGGADNVAAVTMKPEINHLNPMADKLQVDGV